MKHDDEAQDKALFKKMFKSAEKKEPEGMKKGGMAMKKMSSGGPSAAPKYPPKTEPKDDNPAMLKKGGSVKKMAKGGVTGSAMKAMGRNLARARNQKPGSK